MMNRFIPLCLSFALIACKPQMDDLQSFIQQVQQTSPAPIEPYPEFKKTPEFHYGASNLRSPFQRPKNQVVEAVTQRNSNCLQPDTNRSKHALESYGVDALTISGFFTSRKLQWVLFLANDGSLHRAGVGDYLGLFFGKITHIADGVVHITEMLPDGAGCWQQKTNTLSMPAKTGESDNV